MELEEIALEIIKLTDSEKDNKEKLGEEDKKQYVIEEVKRIDEIKASQILRSDFCLPDNCSGSCLEPYRRISFYAYKQVHIFRYLNSTDNDSLNEDIDWKIRVNKELEKFEEIYDKFSQIDLGLHPTQTTSSPLRLNMMFEGQAGEGKIANKVLGIVENKRFVPFVDFGGKFPRRLTKLQMQEGQAPESKEINLDNYEGLVIMVSGNDSGNWIYSAQIVEVGGAILSAIAKKVFG